jgi:serine/threonine-protein kinase
MTDSDSVPSFQSATLGAVVAGRFRLERLLGEGGMGQVFEAEHIALGRRFALKVLRLERWSDELVARFNREARSLARISSPRVAQVTDYGVERNIGPFYVMELVAGETLERRIERVGPIAFDEALHIAAETCEALAEVHDAGIVHRDVKPSNIGLPPAGPVAVKLLDFGLAASVDDSFMQRITQSQQVLGSLPYMAPEQFHGSRPIPQMDIYATGVALFEMLAGRLPFKAPSTAALIHQILASPVPSFTQVAPTLAIPARVEQVVKKLLAKNPADRFGTAREAAEAIRATAERSLATTLPGKVHLPPTRLTPEVSAHEVAETVSVDSDIVSAETSRSDEIIGVAGAPRDDTDDWSSGQVVPPTSYPTPAPAPPARKTGALWAMLLGGGVLLGALAAVGIVAVLDSSEASTAETRTAAGAPPPETRAAEPAQEPEPVAPVSTERATEADAGVQPPRPGEAGATSGATAEPSSSLRAPDRPRARERRRVEHRGEERAPAESATVMDPEPAGMRGGGTWSGEVIEEPEF